ncbi:uncharacterized protein LOC125316496 [Rhodamnia argentea]|uniref:Uncharacterized protein LOC125316496 n=1 Tax=Rhodamnia argentea TaxID=178133 RepID=A0ABM3HW30_9MYRT|nr:uncharacterized protein LOC125316496 [Rhodamnia argentea]
MPLYWDEVGERKIIGLELVQQSLEAIKVIRDIMKTAHSHQKSYADKRRRSLGFQVGDHVFLKVYPMRGTSHFGKKGKLNPRYVGPFEIPKRIRNLACRLTLPPGLARVHKVFYVLMLKKYKPDPTHVLSYKEIELGEQAAYVECLIRIVDRKELVLQNKTIPLVKVTW